MLVTQDADFLRIHGEGASHAGIVYYVAGSLSTGQILKGLVLIRAVLTPEDRAGHLRSSEG